MRAAVVDHCLRTMQHSRPPQISHSPPTSTTRHLNHTLIGRRVGAGTVFMNRCDYLDPELPWTAGGEHTGKGVSLSKHGFGGVTKLKGYNMRV